MKYFSFAFLQFLFINIYAQKIDFDINKITLPKELSFYDNQFSGLYVHDSSLFLMSESRVQDNAEAKLYAIKLADIERTLIDSNFILPFKKWPIYHLPVLKKKMASISDDYEGLEALVINGNDIYFSVETSTPSDNCYIIKGTLNDTAVLLNESDIILQPKPLTPVGTHVYNAGYEAIAIDNKAFYTFFEFNFFPQENIVNSIDLRKFKNVSLVNYPLQKLPFRLTDITNTGKNTFTGINFFYDGKGRDEVYRLPPAEKENNKLIKDTWGHHSYCRLVTIKFKKNKFYWDTLWEFPPQYWGYNWEGIALYRNGYFIVNDKYTPNRPYESVLLYLSPKK